jgi:hypothetical protein
MFANVFRKMEMEAVNTSYVPPYPLFFSTAD